ncbi:hypothetical protein [Rhodococcus sp. NCIMB 12038]|uniref:hypothetical protein n=1 Tax=Rhodococcus sp. NCIMB 12038 TaxID=933800 RepID=UPI000B3CECB8|nr:hypothetical protein [Rhodococcus sp. NCIMB 12038]OUS97335.1 hypothetical protein CA951_03025 [Rhodococcus sp. NCIMB 12038]
MSRQWYKAIIQLAERFDSLTEADLANRIAQLEGFHPEIGWGDQNATAITITFKEDSVVGVNDIAQKLINQRANPNRVDIVKVSVLTTIDSEVTRPTD